MYIIIKGHEKIPSAQLLDYYYNKGDPNKKLNYYKKNEETGKLEKPTYTSTSRYDDDDYYDKQAVKERIENERRKVKKEWEELIRKECIEKYSVPEPTEVQSDLSSLHVPYKNSKRSEKKKS